MTAQEPDKNRAQLLRDGYVIFRNIVPAGLLHRLRSDIDEIVARQRAGDPTWDTTPQPRASIVNHVDSDTISAFEFVLHDHTYGVSAQMLNCPDEAVAAIQAQVLCNPEFEPGDPQRPGQAWGTDPRNWHRDVRPDMDGPLAALLEDQRANGPSYVQWNIALYEDLILYVIPGSHNRLTTQAETNHLLEDRGTLTPVPQSSRVELGPGDGVVYNNLMLHWGSKYSPQKKRRTIHLGYRSFGRNFPRQKCSLPTGFPNRFGDGTSHRRIAERWLTLCQDEFATIEEIFHAVLQEDDEKFFAGLTMIHPPVEGRLKCLILLSKVALALQQRTHRTGGDRLATEAEQQVCDSMLQECAERYTDRQLEQLVQRFGPVDELLRSGRSRHVTGFLGPTTDYEFEEIPSEMTAETVCATILNRQQRIGGFGTAVPGSS